jgi:hypothetical protein
MMMKQKATTALTPGDRFVRYADNIALGDAAPIYTVQRIGKVGFEIFIYTDRGLVRANAAGSVLSVA